VWSPTLLYKFNACASLGYSFNPASTREESTVNSRLVRVLNRSQISLSILTRQLDLRTHTIPPTKSTISHILLTCFDPNHRYLSNYSRKLLPHRCHHVHSSTRTSTSSARAGKSRSIWSTIATAHAAALYFPCSLMQISTRDVDWVVDPFALRGE
jgi:hypothetical protein